MSLYGSEAVLNRFNKVKHDVIVLLAKNTEMTSMVKPHMKQHLNELKELVQ